PEPSTGSRPGGLDELAQTLSLGQRRELLERLVLDLADALARDVERGANLVERARLEAAHAEAHLEHAALAEAQHVEDLTQRLEAHLARRLVLGGRRRDVGDEVPELRVVLVADRLLERDRRLGRAHDLLDLLDRELDAIGDLGRRGITRELGAELALDP